MNALQVRQPSRAPDLDRRPGDIPASAVARDAFGPEVVDRSAKVEAFHAPVADSEMYRGFERP